MNATKWTYGTPCYYYAAKIMGVLPFSGSSNRVAWLVYSVSLWICLGVSGVYVNVYYYNIGQKVSSKHSMIMKVVFLEALSKFAVSIAGTAVSAVRSLRFFGPQDRLRDFDEFTMRLACPPDSRTQTVYLLYVCLVVAYDFASACLYTSADAWALFAWNVLCVTTMLSVVQYATYVRALGERYELANRIFADSVAKNCSAGTKCMHPKDINGLFIQLRGLTEEIKAYYAYHAILIIVESILILVSGVTTLTVNYLNRLDAKYVHSEYFVGHCALRLLFLFQVVRETHGTALEAKKTVSIGHEALRMTSDLTVAPQLELIILNSWNHPIKFDVLDFFDLDYQLLQSIIASVVTYVVVLVQIQLAIIDI